MSTPADWKRIEELAEKATPRPWRAIRGVVLFARLNENYGDTQPPYGMIVGGVEKPVAGDLPDGETETAEFIAAAANHATDMAARLRRVAEIIEPHNWEMSAAQARELLALLTGEKR